MKENIEGLAVAAMVCGLVSILVFPLLFGVVGIGLGLWVTNNLEDKESRAYSNARIGIIAGIVGLALWIITLALMGMLGIDTSALLGSPQGPSAF